MSPSTNDEVQTTVSGPSEEDLKRNGDDSVQVVQRLSSRRRRPSNHYDPSGQPGVNGFYHMQNSVNNEDEDETSEIEETDSLLIHQGAVALASLDRRACARSQVHFANAIFDHIVLPTCLPWSQTRNMLYKTLPRDMDELPSVLFQDSVPLATAFRSSDPGVVELCTFEEDVDIGKRRVPKRQKYEKDVRAEDPMSAPGEWSLQMYHEAQWNRKQHEERTITKTRNISFRVGSTSSRASIFADYSTTTRSPLFLMATYPRQLHEGTKRHGLEAYEHGMNLGSYNCRPLPEKESVLLHDTPSSKHRFVVGRSRIIWSEKERPESKSQRCAYRSVLNGRRLDSTSLKRPLDVKVGIRINGIILNSSAKRPIHSEKVLEYYTHTIKIVQDALNCVCDLLDTNAPLPPLNFSRSQCRLNTSSYVANMEKDYRSFVGDPDLLARRRSHFAGSGEPFSIKRLVSLVPMAPQAIGGTTGTVLHICTLNGNEMQSSTKSGTNNTAIPSIGSDNYRRVQVHIVPPLLECIPTEDGRMHVTCTMPGTMMHRTEVVPPAMASMAEPTDGKSSSFLLRVLASETGRCAICWTAVAQEISRACVGCHVPVHSICAEFEMERLMDNSEWLCSSCAPSNDGLFCSVCNFSEGVLYPWKENKWIHNICRTWCGIDWAPHANSEINSDENIASSIGASSSHWSKDTCCHLCSKNDTPVVGCLGEGCCVRFHPMCAVIASMAQEMRCVELNEQRPRYTLSMLRTSFASSQSLCTKVLPVVFCPFHDPQQHVDPFLDSSLVRVPPRR